MTVRDSIFAMIIVLVWGVNFVVMALGLDTMPPLLMGGLRFLLVFVLGCWFVKKPQIPWKWLIAYAFMISFAQFSFLFISMSLGMPAGLASLILQSQALFTLIFAYFILREQIKLSQVLAIGIAGAGLGLIGMSSGHSSMSFVSFALTILAACSWSIGNLVTRSISQRGYKADVGLVVWAGLVTSVPFFVSSYWFEGPQLMLHTIVNLNAVAVASLFYLALVATIVGYSLWSYLLSRYPAAVVAPLTLGVPVVGLISAWLFLGEQLSQVQWLGGLIVMGGLIINMRVDKVLRASLKRMRASKSQPMSKWDE